MNTSLGNLILSLAGFVPGYWVAFCFIDRWGRKPIQLTGFCALTILLLIMGALPLPSFLPTSPLPPSLTDGHLQASRTTG